MTTIECIKVSALRKTSKDPDINLEKWMSDPNNIYVGRPGRIFITTGIEKKVFYYPGSKFANPFKVGTTMSLEECIKMYKEHLKSSGLIDQIEELRGKNLGCWCDQKNMCHAKILVSYLK